MTYENLIEKIENEETGIAKGYNISFLQDVCCYRNNSEEIFDNLIAKDLKMFASIETALLAIKEPKEGDFVEYADGKFARISVDHRNGTFQLSNNIGVFVSEYGSQASGCVWDPNLDYIKRERLIFDNLKPTSKTMKGRCWMFSEGNAGGHGGVWYDIQFKVWLLG
ncbi:hypothetical protein ACM12L_001835 [Campylobacter jejuni]|nr:hypothetical protein [Campylobacter jejuni]ECO2700690.1 hypothetical protein [Campylobacter coli]ECL1899335.1 hypothetical protein [Campylobacter jejuni]ECP9254668.1 hypothetical protein [Campylobacter coli]EDP2708491.1 hypothetical protein [Campylobacter jejuni]